MPIGQEVSKKSRYLNRRTILGIVLMLVAAILVVVLVRMVSNTEGYLRAGTTVAAGQTIEPGDLETVQVNPGDSAASYFREGEMPLPAVATRTIEKGELLPRSAISQTLDSGTKKIVLELVAPLPSGVRTGEALEIWRLPSETAANALTVETGGADSQLLSPQAVFLTERHSDSALSGKSRTVVEVSVDSEELALILDAVGKKSPLMAIPVAS